MVDVALAGSGAGNSTATLDGLSTELASGLLGEARSHAGISPELADVTLTIDALGISGAIIARQVTLAVLPAEEQDAPLEPEVYAPSGDRFGDAVIISGSNGEVVLTFTGANMEAGETAPAGVTKTLWLIWEADDADNPRVIFNTGVASIDIGTAPTVDALTSVWSGEGSVAAYPDALGIYRIQLGWRPGDVEEFKLVWESEDPPSYDEFLTPFELSGDLDRATLSTRFATLQVGEPVPAGTDTTVWARWEPETAGEATIEATDSALVIRVFEDSVTIGSLVLVASGTGLVTFTADAVPYLVQICDLTEPGT